MMNFLKKIFQNGEQETKKLIEINLQDLEQWFNEKSKPLMEEVQQHIEEAIMKLNEEVQRTRLNVEALENAKLQNPNIPYKAKQYMEGNRRAYTRAISSFLGQMEINNKDYFYLVNFCKEFDILINDLNKGTFRSYTILQEFFANEANKIAQNLKNFDVLFNELKSILNSKDIISVNSSKQSIDNFRQKLKQKLNINLDFKAIEAELKLAISEKDSIMNEIGEFNKSEEHNKFLQLTSEKKEKEKEFYADENQILQSFSVLERPLRKYSHVAFEHEEIVLDYLNEPIGTLASDKSIVLLDVLKNLEELLQTDKLQIDEKKKEKSLEEIKKLSKEFIEQFLKKYFSFKAEIEELDNRISNSAALAKLKNLNSKLEEINLKFEKRNEEFSRLQNEVAKADSMLEKSRNEIEASVKQLFNEEINISV